VQTKGISTFTRLSVSISINALVFVHTTIASPVDLTIDWEERIEDVNTICGQGKGEGYVYSTE
jgi:hypothetical protein